MNNPEESINPDLTRLGHILGPQGVKGAVKVYILGDPQQFGALKRVYLEKRGWFKIRSVEYLAPGIALYLAGVTTRELATELSSLNVYATDDELPIPETGVYYYHELRGLKLLDATGQVLGEVKDVLDSGHQDLLTIAHKGGETFVPLQAPYVVINLNAKKRPLSLTLSEDAPEDLLTGDWASSAKPKQP